MNPALGSASIQARPPPAPYRAKSNTTRSLSAVATHSNLARHPPLARPDCPPPAKPPTPDASRRPRARSRRRQITSHYWLGWACSEKLTILRSTLRPVGGRSSGRQNDTKRKGGNAVNRPRAADDFATIRARMEELRREREGAEHGDEDAQQDLPMPRSGAIRWPPSEVSSGPGRVRQSGSGTHLSSVWDL
jgi:hypothetical protein